MAQYKTSNYSWIFITFFCGLILIGYGYYRIFYINNTVLYKEFGITFPYGNYLHGIDVSKYQKNIDWLAVDTMKIKNISIDFAFIKATEGITIKDRKFDKNWYNIKKTSIRRGAYHFFRANQNPEKQAIFFLSTVNFKEGDLYPVIDVETRDGKSNEELQKRLKICLNKIEQTLNLKPIIYTNADFYQQNLIDFDDTFKQYPLWVAHYLEPNQPRINRNWDFWQHSDKGRVNSIYGFVDFNVFKGNENDLEKFIISNP